MKVFGLLMVVMIGVTFTLAFAADRDGTSHEKMLHHVVLLKFKAGATKEQIAHAEQTFADLKNKIPTIVSLEWGTNVSPEHLNRGYSHAFTLTFKAEKDRNNYLVDPAHKNLGKVLGPILDEVLVIDFWEK